MARYKYIDTNPMTFIALSVDTVPHFTTVGHFVSPLGDDIARVFAAVVAFRGKARDCGPCLLRAACIRSPATTPLRSVTFFRVKAALFSESHTARMERRIDTPEERARDGRRFATVFGNLYANNGLTRFTLRGRMKVEAQRKFFCLAHNTEKLAKAAYAECGLFYTVVIRRAGRT